MILFQELLMAGSLADKLKQRGVPVQREKGRDSLYYLTMKTS